MIAKLLIANRGEIAVRIARTARSMGIATVAVYSDADAQALHVAVADEAVRLGPAPAVESYLNMPAMLEAARRTGADAVHPGYGFLSENPEFVEALDAAGLIFVGPSAQAIRAMGLKDRAKALMAEAGVPVVPGYHGADQDPDFLATRAAEIGYPVLIKATAGGGGKGMRRVDRATEFAEALDSARREAQAAFGNADVLVEKFILNPRHIEIQVFGDGTRAIHLNERDCSLQRRHQKVIEEAPAPGMTPAVRAAMGAAAVRAAEAIGYKGAGTVEFIVDGTGPLREDGFWFMEMNTRLQVEHPVTEAITGIDLVEWQLQVAAGAPLPMRQADVPLIGHAVEARVYAEDPARGFLPVTGRLSHVDFDPRLRVDSGVRAGDEISPYYDPMIAKVIAHGGDRAAALARLAQGLMTSRIAGSTTNTGFLVRLLQHDGFRAGTMDTGLIDRDLDALVAADPPTPGTLAAVALAALDLPRAGATGFALWVPLVWSRTFGYGEQQVTLSVSPRRGGGYAVRGDGWALGVTDVQRSETGLRLVSDGALHAITLATAPDRITAFQNGQALVFHRVDPLAAAAEASAGGDRITAPMPGLVRACPATPGARVAAGDVLVVLEAMKMEHALRAPRDGVIAEVRIAAGAQVSDGDTLVLLETEDD